MHCPVCHYDHISFLGIWYEKVGELFILKTHYGCESCRVMFSTPVSEDSFHYAQESGGIIMRPTPVALKHERRLHVVDLDPGYYVRRT